MALDMNMILDLLQFEELASGMIIVSVRDYPSAAFVLHIFTFVGLCHSGYTGYYDPLVFRSLLFHSQGINIKT